MDWKLEVIVIPVADVARSLEFYATRVGFRLDVDHRAGDDFRVVQLTPPGSACSITLMKNEDSAGTLQGLHLIVSDIDAARRRLDEGGASPSAVFHFEEGEQREGVDPLRADYGSFHSFSDPDGNGWLVQEVKNAVR